MKRTPLNRISKRQSQIKREEVKIRASLLEKCGGYCMECGERPDWRGLSLHHKQFKSRGGTNEDNNTALICGKCHSKYHGVTEK
jgi:5-methylcytosine-specific restriction endonuclease McrA